MAHDFTMTQSKSTERFEKLIYGAKDSHRDKDSHRGSCLWERPKNAERS